MKKIFFPLAFISAIFVFGVFFACELVNNKDEELELRPTVEKHENGYSITVPVQSGMKYATFYRISSDNSTLRGENTKNELIAQCFIEDSKLTEEGLRIIQIFDDFTSPSVQYYGYYVRFESSDSKKTGVSDSVIAVGTEEAELSATEPCMTFYFNKGTNIAKITLDTEVVFPEKFLRMTENTVQLCFVIEKTTGNKEKKLITFAVPSKNTNVEGDTVDKENFCDLSLGLPEDFYGVPLKLCGLVGMYTEDCIAEKTAAYRRSYWTNILESDLKIKGIGVDGKTIDDYDGETTIKDKIFTIPKPAAKESIDFY